MTTDITVCGEVAVLSAIIALDLWLEMCVCALEVCAAVRLGGGEGRVDGASLAVGTCSYGLEWDIHQMPLQAALGRTRLGSADCDIWT
jgi:hypothetical protein